MPRKEKKSFILYHSYENQLRLLSLEDRGRLITAIFEYDRTGIPPQGLPPVVEMALSFIRTALDRDREEYEEVSRRNSENGKKGGRPRKNEKAEKTHPFSEKTKKAYNDNDNDNDNDDDNGNGKEEEKKKEKETAPFPAEILPLWAPPTSEAPPPVGPRLTEEEKKELLSGGLTEDYINKRLLRAASFAELQGKPIRQILWEWWEQDRRSTPPPKTKSQAFAYSKSTPAMSATPFFSSLPKTYDLDDFFQAALNRAWA